MSFTLAVAGKGGTGKTSLSSLFIRYLLKNKLTPVLAVDADPNANLGESLGLKVGDSVGHMLDDFQKAKLNIPPGMTKEAYLEIKLNTLLVESPGLDLLSMGHGESAGCYCYPNTILKKFIDRLSGSYPYLVMDNEAGMEHLSRGTTQDIDELVIVSNHSIKGVRTIARIRELVSELKLRVKHQSIIINMVPLALENSIIAELEKLKIGPVLAIPEDPAIIRFDLEMKSLIELPESSAAVQIVDRYMQEITQKSAKL